MKIIILTLSFLLAACGGSGSKAPDSTVNEPPKKPTGYTITDGDIEIKACPKYAGAICSVKYKGVEIVDNHDFGRQFQTAVNYSTSSGPESYNPTEAGNFNDVRKGASTSQLLSIDAQDNTIYTSSQMAYWLEPNQCSKGSNSCAVNTKKISNTYITKSVSIGYEEFKNVIKFSATFDIEADVDEGVNLEKPIQFQSLVTHTQGSWDKFYYLDDGELFPMQVPQKNINTARDKPIISSSRDGEMAIALLKIHTPNYATDVYSIKHANKAGSSLQGEVGVVAMFNVYRTNIESGTTHTFDTLIVLGTLEEVKETLINLQ